MAVSRPLSLQTIGGALLALAIPGLAPAQERSPLAFNIGTGVTVTPYGYIKADFIWDLDYDLGRTTSGLSNIGLPDGPEAGEFDRQQLSQTRIGFTVDNGNDIFARFEGDFFGPDDELRLRHASLEWGPLLVGQSWTNFMSVESFADTVDFDGPGALPFALVPQVRLTYAGIERVELAASIEEDPGNDDDYVYAVSGRYQLDDGMLRAAGLWRDATLEGNEVDGWGINLSSVLGLWEGGTFKSDFVFGEGISDILTAGLGGNALFRDGEANRVNAATISLSHEVNDRLLLAASGSWIDVKNATDTDTSKLTSLHLSAFYEVYANTILMAEYFTGQRKDGNGDSFDADRIQLALQYNF